ncbi:MAG: hypothetical protein ACOYB1_18470 [Limnohabitans sp.]
MNALLQPIRAPLIPSLTPPIGNANWLSSLPRSGLLFKCGVSGIDTIGLLITEFWAQCPVAHRSIYSADGTAWYDAEDIITNIEASESLNDGGELGGSVAKGYFQYLDGTDEAIMRRAYRWAGVAWPVVLEFATEGGDYITTEDSSNLGYEV